MRLTGRPTERPEEKGEKKKKIPFLDKSSRTRFFAKTESTRTELSTRLFSSEPAKMKEILRDEVKQKNPKARVFGRKSRAV